MVEQQNQVGTCNLVRGAYEVRGWPGDGECVAGETDRPEDYEPQSAYLFSRCAACLSDARCGSYALRPLQRPLTSGYGLSELDPLE